MTKTLKVTQIDDHDNIYQYYSLYEIKSLSSSLTPSVRVTPIVTLSKNEEFEF